jgi:sugar lactone lactonase YvrE
MRSIMIATMLSLSLSLACGGAEQGRGAPTSAKGSDERLPRTPLLRFAGSLSTPESVLWDEEADRYLVSNIGGNPLDRDGNGYISELSPDGGITRAKWIAGGVGGARLDAPKGIAISAGVLYVADIDTLRMFDAGSGAPKGELTIAGATFLNDVAVGADGKVYVSDSGLRAGASGFEPTGSDAVYVVEGGAVRAIAKRPDLGRPNGLLPDGGGVWVVTFGSGELYRLDADGGRREVSKLPLGALDGIVRLDGSTFVSSWEGSMIYRSQAGGRFEPFIAGVKAPADIGLDRKRRRILVPRFSEDAVEVYAADGAALMP